MTKWNLVAPVAVPLFVVAPRIAQLDQLEGPDLLDREQRVSVPLHQPILTNLLLTRESTGSITQKTNLYRIHL